MPRELLYHVQNFVAILSLLEILIVMKTALFANVLYYKNKLLLKSGVVVKQAFSPWARLTFH